MKTIANTIVVFMILMVSIACHVERELNIRDVTGVADVQFDSKKVELKDARYIIIHNEDAKERQYQFEHLTYTDTIQNIFMVAFTLQNKQNTKINKLKVTRTITTVKPSQFDNSQSVDTILFSDDEAIQPGEENEIKTGSFMFRDKNWFEIDQVLIEVNIE